MQKSAYLECESLLAFALFLRQLTCCRFCGTATCRAKASKLSQGKARASKLSHSKLRGKFPSLSSYLNISTSCKFLLLAIL
ncbi:hypothetical protein HY792_04115 [Candidatus Desantisbacteria bacterium]|nr:hypothetical protein [Candidatus Desantisbacteria bacterium]